MIRPLHSALAAFALFVSTATLATSPAAADPQLKSIGGGCYAHADCPGSMFCRLGKCSPECTVDKECALGQRCGAEQRCELIVLPGTVAGRVEKAPGEPVACDATLGQQSVRCSAGGEFIFDKVPAGRHRVVISVKYRGFRVRRTLTAFVAAGATFYLGLVTVPPLPLMSPLERPKTRPAIPLLPHVR